MNLVKKGDKMKSSKKAEKIIGVLFILATVSAITGLILYDPILNGSDYLIEGSEHTNQVKLER